MKFLSLIHLAGRSAWSRRVSLALLVVCVSTSAALLLSLDLIRQSAKESFSQSVSGTDLIVGGPGSPLGLMLYSVFRMGEPARELPSSVLQNLERDPRVAWAIPLSLGDSYRGYSVVGTVAAYFQHFRYGAQTPLSVQQGRGFSDYQAGDPVEVLFEAVLGSEVAKQLNHQLGDELALSHGTPALSGASDLQASHGDKPFKVVGILAPTGTPVDRSVHIGLAGLEAIHLDWQAGAPVKGMSIPAQWVGKFDLKPKAVTAVLVGLKSRAMVFTVKRSVESLPGTALTAVMPGVALGQLWEMLAGVEKTLWLISALVGLVSALGLVGVMLMSLSQRRTELAILRSLGAGRGSICCLMVVESAGVMLAGVLLAYGAVALVMTLCGAALQAEFGIQWVGLGAAREGHLAVSVYALGGALLGLIPAWGAYRQQVQAGLVPRV